ncbi:MAG: DUF2169 domain-containing protein [Polyangiales bacterium]
MRVLRDTPFAFGFLVFALRPPQRSLVVVVKGTFVRGEDGAWAPAPADAQAGCAGEVHWEDDDTQSLRDDSDFALHKPCAEVLLRGTFHAGATAVTSGVASFRFGPVQRALAVFGERTWNALGGLSEPAPFLSLPLRWEHAYGGPGHPTNPVGVGADRRAPPRIEDPLDLVTEPRSRPEPAGAFPIPRAWPQRAGLTGTYDRAWRKQRWPWLPVDFDWSYFLAAPPAQRVQGYFRGDEEFAWSRLDPALRLVEGRLPGLRARAFVQLEPVEGGEFREVPLVLDTVVLDADNRRVLCTWRGVTPVASEALTEVAHLFYVHEPLDAQTPLAACRAWYLRRLAEEAADDDVEPEVPGEPPLAEVLAPYHPALQALSIDPQEFLAALESPPTPITLAENRANLARLRASVEADGAELTEALDAVARDLDAVAAQEPVDGAARRAQVVARLAEGARDFTGEDLTGADLSELDLRGVCFKNAVLRGVSLDRSALDGADLSGADLGEATARAARFVGANLAGVEAAGTGRAGGGFLRRHPRRRGARGRHPRRHPLGRGERARRGLRRRLAAAGAVSARDARRRRPRPRDAPPGGFHRGVDARGLPRRRALRRGGVRPRAADQPPRGRTGRPHRRARARAFARDARLQDSVLDKADLSFSNLEGADFSQSSMVQATLNQCVLRRATFRGAVLVGAVILKSDAMEGCFEAARLSHADLRGTSLFGAAFWEAETDEVRWELADLRRTLLDPEVSR